MFKVGDRVTPIAGDDRVPRATVGRAFVVTKVNPKNIKARAEDGGRGINFPADMLTEATDEALAARPPIGVPFRPRDLFAPGEVVTLKTPWRDWGADKPLVVIKDDGGKRVNVVPLGGDGSSRYLRTAPSGLVKRDLDWVADRLTR